MRVVSLDTTTRGGSVALVDDHRVIEEASGDPSRTHGERLPGEILALLARHGVLVSDVDVFAVASGPGSFTGLRIGIATIQGLAVATGRRIVAVSALDALAQQASAHLEEGALIAAWMDAHRAEVFAALYRVHAARLFDPARLVEIEGPTAADAASTLARWADHLTGRPVSFVGDGADLYAAAIQAEERPAVHIVSTPLIAGAIGCMAIAAVARNEAIDPGAVRPLYVRRPDAELDRERKTLHQGRH
jgi:tRNA threonylcarbamoyladenosine biosynthesis protein TsaB